MQRPEYRGFKTILGGHSAGAAMARVLTGIIPANL
jgi:hypothetical protein